MSFNNIKVYTNAERSRTFLALKLDNLYYEKMLNILHKVDKVMKDFKLATFYEVTKKTQQNLTFLLICIYNLF